MDPNANLEQQLNCARAIQRLDDSIGDSSELTEGYELRAFDERRADIEEQIRDEATGLAALVLALDEWRRNGGFDPYVEPNASSHLHPRRTGGLAMSELFIPTIVFSDDAIDSAIHVLHSLADLTVDLEIPDNTGYPCERVSVVRVDPDGDVVVCETNEAGAPIGNATWAVPVNLIKKVTVL